MKTKHLVKSIIKKTPIYIPIKNWLIWKRQKKEILEWKRNGRPNPPPHIIKQQTLKYIAEKFGLDVLVETGTFYGEMVEAMRSNFKKIYSIELSKDLYNNAKKRFQYAGNVELIHGDSGVELGDLIDKLDEPALFWLDGHYSEGITAKGDKETPIYQELGHIFNSNIKEHVIIIDDSRCFGTYTDYPTIEEITKYIKLKKPDSIINIKEDSIRITPRN